MGSRSPTRDECGWTFAPRSSKRGFQVSEKGGSYTEKWEAGTKGSEGELTNKATFMSGVHVCVVAHMNPYLMNVVFRL